MQLYTVVIEQIKMVSKFGADGKKISDTEERVKVRITDLPLVTAQMYRTTDKNGGGVEIIPQAVSQRTDRPQQRREDYSFGGSAKSVKKPRKQVSDAAAKAAEAARTGDLSAAINS